MMIDRRRGSYHPGRRRREELLDIALEVFAIEGYQGTSLRTVAQRAGISVAGVLHHFGSREQLFADALRRRDQQARQRAEAAQPEGGWQELLSALAHNAEEPGLVELFVTMTAAARRPDHPARGFLVEHYRELEERITAYIEKHRSSLKLPPDLDAGRIARLVIAIADGAQMRWMIHGGSLTEDLDTLWDLVASSPTQSPSTNSEPLPTNSRRTSSPRSVE